MSRVTAYVDGFNFYYAIKEASRRGDFPRGLGWCDFRKLADQHLAVAGDTVDTIKYFTARIGAYATSPRETERQQIWLDAVQTIPGLKVIYGFHQRPNEKKRREEKKTDVNIAVELLVDAYDGACERAILITGDIDQAPAVRAASKRLPPGKRVDVSVWVPPGLTYKGWKREAADLGMDCREITPEMLAGSRLRTIS